MQNKLTETLTSFISEITQMERNNTKLNEDIRELEKEKEKGYKSFDTETHILVERETLSDILRGVDELRSNADYTLEEIETAERSISDARYNADDVRDSARNLECDIEALLIEYVKEEKEDKAPAVKKVIINKGDNNA